MDQHDFRTTESNSGAPLPAPAIAASACAMQTCLPVPATVGLLQRRIWRMH